MNCPKYIVKALAQRARAAERFMHYDLIVSKFVEKHNIKCETYDTFGGTESILNPSQSSWRVYAAIYAKEDE